MGPRARDYSAADLRGNVVLTLPADHVSVGIPWRDPATGAERLFNAARVPDGTVAGGFDLGGWEFHPTFVNASPLGEGFREVPLRRGREVWLRRMVVGEDGRFAIDGRGHRERQTAKVDPELLAEAVEAAARRADGRGEPGGRDGRDGRDGRPLAERADAARYASVSLSGGERCAGAPARGAPAAGR